MWNWITTAEVSNLSNLTSIYKKTLSVDELAEYKLSPL